MPRYDDRYGNTRLYVGHLSSRTRTGDLEEIFSKYGRVRDVDMKHDYAFVEFSDPQDADDARYNLNGRELDRSRITVEFAKGGPRGSGGPRSSGGSREYVGRGPPPGSGRCFNCGIDGHWARDCKAGDWKNKCYRCGERGHIERNCQNSPKKTRPGHSYSPSPSPRRGRRSYSRSPSYSRSRSPAPRRNGRTVERERSRSPVRSPAYSRSPPPSKARKSSLSPDVSRSPRYRSPPPSKGRNNSLSPDGRSPHYKSPPPVKGRKRSLSPAGSRSPRHSTSPPPSKVRKHSLSPDDSRSPRDPSPKEHRQADSDRSDRSRSPRRETARSPMSHEPENPTGVDRSRSPAGYRSPERNGRSPSPRDVADENDHRASPRGSDSGQE